MPRVGSWEPWRRGVVAAAGRAEEEGADMLLLE